MLRESAGTHPHLEQKEQPTIEQKKSQMNANSRLAGQNRIMRFEMAQLLKKMFYITLKCSNT